MAPLTSYQLSTRAARSTQSLARQLAARLRPGNLLALAGELGAGKTTFVQGLAAGWGVDNLREVVSPTYTLVNEYPAARGVLCHLDFYRLENAAAALALGLDEVLHRDDALVVVEWADRFAQLIPGHAIWVRLRRGVGRERQIVIEGLHLPAGWRRG